MSASSTSSSSSASYDLNRSIECPIDLEPMETAVSLFPCTHKLCAHCAEENYGKMENGRCIKKACIICQQNVTSYYPDFTLRELVKGILAQERAKNALRSLAVAEEREESILQKKVILEMIVQHPDDCVHRIDALVDRWGIKRSKLPSSEEIRRLSIEVNLVMAAYERAAARNPMISLQEIPEYRDFKTAHPEGNFDRVFQERISFQNASEGRQNSPLSSSFSSSSSSSDTSLQSSSFEGVSPSTSFHAPAMSSMAAASTISVSAGIMSSSSAAASAEDALDQLDIPWERFSSSSSQMATTSLESASSGSSSSAVAYMGSLAPAAPAASSSVSASATPVQAVIPPAAPIALAFASTGDPPSSMFSSSSRAVMSASRFPSHSSASSSSSSASSAAPGAASSSFVGVGFSSSAAPSSSSSARLALINSSSSHSSSVAQSASVVAAVASRPLYYCLMHYPSFNGIPNTRVCGNLARNNIEFELQYKGSTRKKKFLFCSPGCLDNFRKHIWNPLKKQNSSISSSSTSSASSTGAPAARVAPASSAASSSSSSSASSSAGIRDLGTPLEKAIRDYNEFVDMMQKGLIITEGEFSTQNNVYSQRNSLWNQEDEDGDSFATGARIIWRQIRTEPSWRSSQVSGSSSSVFSISHRSDSSPAASSHSGLYPDYFRFNDSVSSAALGSFSGSRPPISLSLSACLASSDRHWEVSGEVEQNYASRIYDRIMHCRDLAEAQSLMDSFYRVYTDSKLDNSYFLNAIKRRMFLSRNCGCSSFETCTHLADLMRTRIYQKCGLANCDNQVELTKDGNEVRGGWAVRINQKISDNGVIKTRTKIVYFCSEQHRRTFNESRKKGEKS